MDFWFGLLLLWESYRFYWPMFVSGVMGGCTSCSILFVHNSDFLINFLLFIKKKKKKLLIPRKPSIIYPKPNKTLRLSSLAKNRLWYSLRTKISQLQLLSLGKNSFFSSETRYKILPPLSPQASIISFLASSTEDAFKIKQSNE